MMNNNDLLYLKNTSSSSSQQQQLQQQLQLVVSDAIHHNNEGVTSLCHGNFRKAAQQLTKAVNQMKYILNEVRRGGSVSSSSSSVSSSSPTTTTAVSAEATSGPASSSSSSGNNNTSRSTFVLYNSTKTMDTIVVQQQQEQQQQQQQHQCSCHMYTSTSASFCFRHLHEEVIVPNFFPGRQQHEEGGEKSFSSSSSFSSPQDPLLFVYHKALRIIPLLLPNQRTNDTNTNDTNDTNTSNNYWENMTTTSKHNLETIMSIYSSCILYNLGLLYHGQAIRLPKKKNTMTMTTTQIVLLRKAEQLYTMAKAAVRVASITTPPTRTTTSNCSGYNGRDTILVVQLATMNNQSQIQFEYLSQREKGKCGFQELSLYIMKMMNNKNNNNKNKNDVNGFYWNIMLLFTYFISSFPIASAAA